LALLSAAVALLYLLRGSSFFVKGADVTGPKLDVQGLPPSVAFRGLPCLIEVRLRNVSPRIELGEVEKLPATERREMAVQQYFHESRMLQFAFPRGPAPVGIRIRRKGGGTIKESEHPGSHAYWIIDPKEAQGLGVPVPAAHLPRNVWRGFVLDLAPWTSELKPGEYEMSIAV
jgi:hypothetical protein